MPRRKTSTPADVRRDQLRQARADAPTLHEFLPAAAEVSTELTFLAGAWRTPASRLFTVYPPAQAHFVYACPFGDCDGTYDLNEEILGLLRGEARHATGLLHCTGHRARISGLGPPCGLGVEFAVTVCYSADQAASRGQSA